MQTLGQFCTSDGAQAFIFVAVAFDASTRQPSFALIQENPTDVPVVMWNGTSIETRGLLSDAIVVCSRPNAGGGILRRTCSLSIQTEHAKGYPFFKDILTKGFFYGGQPTNSFYFGLYAIDRQFMFQDLTAGLFLGFYQVDAGLTWTEKSGCTQIPLIDILINDVTLVGATNEDIPPWFYIFNPWFTGNALPKAFGQVPRVKMLNSFPTISTKNLSGTVNGIVHADYSAGATVGDLILLETNVSPTSPLMQLYELGGTARIKFANGEVMSGFLVYNLSLNTLSLNIQARNTYYAQASGYTDPTNGETPEDWGFATGQPQKHPVAWSDKSTILINGKNIVQDANGWIQANVEYYVSPGTWPFELSAAKMNGWSNQDKGILLTSYFNNAAHDNQTLLSFRFTTGPFAPTPPGTPAPVYTGWPGLPYMYFDGVYETVNLFFIDPGATLAGGHAGDKWSMVGFDAGGGIFECFLRNGFSHFISTAVYAEGEGRLIQIPGEKIVSLTESGTFHGLSNMCRVVLTGAPIDLGIGAINNNVYIDCLYRTGTHENRTEAVIYSILQESNLYLLAGDNLNGAALEPTQWCPYIGYVANGSDTLSNVIDRICFQIGATMKWLGSKFWIRTASRTDVIDKVPTDVEGVFKIKLTCPYTDKREMIENSAEINFGKIQTAINGDGFEYIPLFFEATFGGWEDPFYKDQTRAISKAMKPNERKVTYAFNLINDVSSCVQAIFRFLCIGHPSATSSVQRTFKTSMTMHGCRWEACDPIAFRDFPLISTADETNAIVDPSGDLLYPDTTDKTPYLIGALACVDSVEYHFNTIDPEVILTARQSQPWVNAHGGGGGGGAPGAPTPPGNPPPPGDPPGNNGNTNTGPTTGGGCMDPLGILISGGGDDVEIDDLTVHTVMFTVTVDTSTGCRGGAWIAEIVDELHTGGASIGIISGGVIGDKVDDSYVVLSWDVNVNIDYHWLLTDRTSRNCKVKFTFNGSNADGSVYTDVQYREVPVNLKPLLDIEES